MQSILVILGAVILLVSAVVIGTILWVASGEPDVNGDPENDSKN